MRESKIENYLRDELKAHGADYFKFVSPGTNGVPDELVLYKGKTYFIETKATGKKPRANQVSIQRRFAKQNIKIFYISTLPQVDDFIKTVLKAKRIKKKENGETLSPLMVDIKD